MKWFFPLLMALLLACCGKVQSAELAQGWHAGPVPAGTYEWGAVVLQDQEGAGFYFADFKGDHLTIYRGDNKVEVKPWEVKFWNNGIKHPFAVGKPTEAPKLRPLQRLFQKTAYEDPLVRVLREQDELEDAFYATPEGKAYAIKHGLFIKGVNEPDFLLTAAPAAASGDGPDLAERLKRVKVRSFLHLKMLQTKDTKDKAAIAKVLQTPELFNSFMDGLSEAHATGKVEDLLNWMKDNWMDVLKIVLQLVAIFADENKQADALWEYQPPPVFALASMARDCPGGSCPVSQGRGPVLQPQGKLRDRLQGLGDKVKNLLGRLRPARC